jgi:uncharacterized membrane protein YbhN (UPF0104 family)
MHGKLRRWWPVVKALLALAILVAIGLRFAADLRSPASAGLWQRSLRPGWLLLSGLLYLAGIGCSALYWRSLLGHLGVRPPLAAAVRAYYVGHLGKYLPGKAWAVLLRAAQVRPAGVPLGLAALTSFYEVLTTMASGALVAALLFGLCGEPGGPALTPEALQSLARLEAPAEGVGRATALALALFLAAGTGLPLLPAVFNRVAARMRLPGREQGAPVPRIGLAHLAEGLGTTAVGWLLLGASLVCALWGVGSGYAPDWVGLGRLTAGLGAAYVAGFVFLLPGGLGAREFFLTLFLVPELAGPEGPAARGTAVLTAGVLRLVWTAADLVSAAAVTLLPTRPRGGPVQ